MNEVSLKITGEVQGVFFRDHIKRAALGLGLKGFAKNEADGSVTVTAQGEKEHLQSLIEAAKQGSPRAHVENIETKWSQAKKKYENFATF